MNILSEDDVAAIRHDRANLRDMINNILVGDRKTLRQWFLAYHGFREATVGRRRKVSQSMTPNMRIILKQAPVSLTDRELAQQYNLAIGDVSNVRRGTRR